MTDSVAEDQHDSNEKKSASDTIGKDARLAGDISSDAVAQLLTSRRTINNFKPELPPRELILKAIDVARFAPNHHLTEPWHFYLLGEDAKSAVIEVNSRLVAEKRGTEAAQAKRERWSQMPGWLVVSCDRNEDPVLAREDYAAVCCAVHSMTLYLWSVGVGCKWTSGPVTREPEFFDHVWIDPEREDVVGLIWYGYPENVPDATRKPLDQILIDI